MLSTSEKHGRYRSKVSLTMVYHLNTREQLVVCKASEVVSLPFEVEVEGVLFVGGRRV